MNPSLPSQPLHCDARATRNLRAGVAIGLALALSACDLPTLPVAPPADATPAALGPQWPPPVQSAAGCDLYLLGVVMERTTRKAVTDATVSWRHFEGGPYEAASELRANANGRYNVCVPVPSSVDCESGACSVKYEVRARKSGYAADSTSVIAEYNYWNINFFRVPDLQLVPEE